MGLGSTAQTGAPPTPAAAAQPIDERENRSGERLDGGRPGRAVQHGEYPRDCSILGQAQVLQPGGHAHPVDQAEGQHHCGEPVPVRRPVEQPHNADAPGYDGIPVVMLAWPR